MSMTRRLLLKLLGGATIPAVAAAASTRDVPIKAPEPTGPVSGLAKRLIVPRDTNCFFSVDWRPRAVVYDDGEPVPEAKLLVMPNYYAGLLHVWSVEVRA